LVGRLLDRWGGRWVMTAGSLIMAGCLFALAGTSGILSFYFFYIIGRAAVVSVMSLADSVSVANWFIRNRGPAIAIQNLGTRGGQALLPAAVALIIAGSGWRAAFLLLGLLVLTLAVIPSLIFVRRRPEDVGLYPDGLPPGARTPMQQQEEVNWTARKAIRTRAFWLLTVATSISMAAHAALFLHVIAYLQDRGLSAAVAVSVLSLLSVTGGLGGIVGGFIERHLGARWTLTLSLTGQATSMILLLNIHTLPLAYLFALYYGLVNGTTLTLNSLIFATYFGRRSLGTIRGIASPIQLVTNALGPFLGGLTYDLTGSYALAFSAFGALYLVGAGCMVLASQPRLQPVPKPQTAPA
jgi:MFS family permease